MTRETAIRLIRRKGGLARARQMRANGFQHLDNIRPIAYLSRIANSSAQRPCKHCRTIGERVLALLAALRTDSKAELSSETLAIIHGQPLPSQPKRLW